MIVALSKIVEQILLVSTLGNVWRICILMLECKGLNKDVHGKRTPNEVQCSVP